MSNPNTEHGERVREANYRDAAQKVVIATEYVLGEQFDIAARHELTDRIVALLNSQTGGQVALSYSAALKFVNDWLWNPPSFGSAERSTDQMPWHDPYKQDAAQMVIAASNRVATRMRDICIAKVRELAAHYDGLATTEYDQPAAIASVLRKLAHALESVTSESGGNNKMSGTKATLPDRVYIDADYDAAEYQGHGGFFTEKPVTGEVVEYIRANLQSLTLEQEQEKSK